MSRNFLFTALAFGSATLGAQTASFNLTLTPENNGADTRFSWSYTGNPTIGPTALTSSSISIYGLSFVSGAVSDPFYTSTGSPGTAFTTNLEPIVGLNTGLVLTNTTTQASRALNEFTFFYNGDGDVLAAISLQWISANTNPITAGTGEELVLSGPNSGSFLSGIAFSNFTPGSWTLDQGIYYNFDPILTVSGTPVPEPSTYGLVLGGLALAGAAIRRRRTK